jgi:hypothetical protein
MDALAMEASVAGQDQGQGDIPGAYKMRSRLSAWKHVRRRDIRKHLRLSYNPVICLDGYEKLRMVRFPFDPGLQPRTATAHGPR